MELKGKKINFLGDSITEWSGTEDAEKRFTNIIAREYGAVCRNYGIGGTRIARQHGHNDFGEDFCVRALEMDKDADIIVIFGGTNDFGHGDAPIGKIDDNTSDTFYGALNTLYCEVITRYPDSLIVVLTPLHRCNEANKFGDNKPEEVGTLKDYVDIIRERAEYYSFPVLDLYACSGLQPNVPVIKEKFFVPDGLHPNNAGHIILADKIAKFLKNM